MAVYDRDDARVLLFGTPIGTGWVNALAWCALNSVVGYLSALRLYDRSED